MSRGKHVGTATISSTAGAPANSSWIDLTAADTFTSYENHRIGVAGATVQSSTVILQVDVSPNSTGDARDLQKVGSTAPIRVPQGGARLIDDMTFPRVRVQSSSGEASDRSFEFWIQ